MRVEKQWHRLPRVLVKALSLETFEARLDGVGLIWQKISPLAF